MLAAMLYQDEESCPPDPISQATCRVAEAPVDTEIAIDFRARDIVRLDDTRATIRADRASGLFQVDFSRLFIDSRETRKGWKPRATIVGPLRPDYSPLAVTGTIPGPMDDSYISASAYSDWRRIVAAAGNRDARWIALRGDRFTTPYEPIDAYWPNLVTGTLPVGLGFGLMGVFDYDKWPSLEVPDDVVFDPAVGVDYVWGDRSRGGSVKYGSDGLPRSAEYHSRDNKQEWRTHRLTLTWADQSVPSLPPASRTLSMQGFMRAKQSVNWRGLLDEVRNRVRAGVCQEADGRAKVFRLVLRRELRSSRQSGWTSNPIKVWSFSGQRAAIGFRDPLKKKKRTMTVEHPSMDSQWCRSQSVWASASSSSHE